MNTLDLLDRPIAYHRVFVTLTGSVKAAVLLSQAVYWQKRAKQADGWWYKTAEEWTDETGLTKHEQDTARRDCEKYLKTDLRGIPATLYWKVDEEALSKDLFDESGKTSFTESVKLDLLKQQNINRNTETTTENKPDLLDGMIKYHISPKAIQDAFRDYFKLTPNWEAKYNAQFMQWAVETGITPEQVKQAADLWRTDKRFNWHVPTLKDIQEHWLELVEIEQSQTYKYPKTELAEIQKKGWTPAPKRNHA